MSKNSWTSIYLHLRHVVYKYFSRHTITSTFVVLAEQINAHTPAARHRPHPLEIEGATEEAPPLLSALPQTRLTTAVTGCSCHTGWPHLVPFGRVVVIIRTKKRVRNRDLHKKTSVPQGTIILVATDTKKRATDHVRVPKKRTQKRHLSELTDSTAGSPARVTQPAPFAWSANIHLQRLIVTAVLPGSPYLLCSKPF